MVSWSVTDSGGRGSSSAPMSVSTLSLRVTDVQLRLSVVGRRAAQPTSASIVVIFIASPLALTLAAGPLYLTHWTPNTSRPLLLHPRCSAPPWLRQLANADHTIRPATYIHRARPTHLHSIYWLNFNKSYSMQVCTAIYSRAFQFAIQIDSFRFVMRVDSFY